MNSRLEKLEKLRESNIEVYPRDFPGRISIKKVLTNFAPKLRKELNSPLTEKSFKIAGRIMSCRNHGQNIFFNLMDSTGEIQLHAKRPDDDRNTFTDENRWNRILECDLGDIIGVEGTLAQNPRGEPLFKISDWTLLAKCLIEPPDKHHGLQNPEEKYRHRERDLLSSADSRALFKTRAEIIFEIRKYLNEKDFVEIECPVLQPIYGGATARPFETRHNSLGQDFFLSISSELYLKRALVGGFDRVYSFSRCFRNEGISPEHNPEFTNLEIFESCSTSNDMLSFTVNLIRYLEERFIPGWFTHRNKLKFDRDLLSSDWPLSRKIISKSIDNLKKRQKELQKQTGIGGNVIPSKIEYAEAWELYINDIEIASGASDLNDPHEQEKRLKESENNAKSFDEKQIHSLSEGSISDRQEYDPYDKNYIEALEMGALPWSGVGIGIDRLIMLLTGKTNIRNVIMFPTLRQISADD